MHKQHAKDRLIQVAQRAIETGRSRRARDFFYDPVQGQMVTTVIAVELEAQPDRETIPFAFLKVR